MSTATTTNPSATTAAAAIAPTPAVAFTGQTLVIKVGTSSICDSETQRPRLSLLSALVETIVDLRAQGHRVVLVTSGAIGVGMRAMHIGTRPKHLARLQALAGVGQSQLMTLYHTLFAPFDVHLAQVLLSRGDVADRTRYLNACNALRELLDMGVVPVVNENDAVSVAEIKFGDNDTLSAVVARMVQAQWLFLMTDVDALYDDNPRTNPNAKAVRVVQDVHALKVNVSSGAGSSVGTGGMLTKLVAAELATAAGCTVTVMLSTQPGMIVDAMREPDTNVTIGTRFLAHKEVLPDKKWWVLHGLKSAGAVVVDAGARAALAHRSSLFAIGVVGVQGTFSAQQAVDVLAVDDAGELRGDKAREAVAKGEVKLVKVAKGIATYSSVELRQIMGHRSDEIAAILGYAESESCVERGSVILVEGEGQGVKRRGSIV
ncbi:Aspartate/glutamate/uridylate kinase [Catenaria anguillulae PL171]|uniref:Aspartate/glutamate/uridylate kinase n=1 Tax=Catenaria anguillulae PL171 TaxID=765915 RepID=A0A1Y2HEY7_9FUNG|nr:Aspartate/glutamate/uridylate kinase [Catenaria anguillulae PL171]